jgi:hypothetical protein
MWTLLTLHTHRKRRLFSHPFSAGSASLADALAGLSNHPGGFNAFMESLRSEGLMGSGGGSLGGLGGGLSAALSSLGLPAFDGPSSAVAQRKRANRGTRLTDIIKVGANHAWSERCGLGQLSGLGWGSLRTWFSEMAGGFRAAAASKKDCQVAYLPLRPASIHTLHMRLPKCCSPH